MRQLLSSRLFINLFIFHAILRILHTFTVKNVPKNLTRLTEQVQDPNHYLLNSTSTILVISDIQRLSYKREPYKRTIQEVLSNNIT